MTKQIQLIVHTEHGCHRNLLRGVSGFAREREDWELHISPYEMAAGGSLYDAGVDGLITHHYLDSAMQRLARDPQIPVVYYGFKMAEPRFRNSIQVFPDDSKIGPMAAAHFLDRGFQTLVYGHNGRWPCSEDRGRAFCDHIEAHDADCRWLDLGAILEKHPRNSVDELARALAEIPKPMGILAINDVAAAFILRALRRAEIEVPGQAALLGVDNDELLCTSQSPALSSLDTDWYEIGRQSAEALDRMLSKQSVEPGTIAVAPKEVCLRASTDFLAFPDEIVVKALCFIRDQLKNGVTVQDVLAHTLVSRPTLDNRFRANLGHTVTEEISRTRLERACRLLAETELTIEQIAYETGYKYPDALFRSFRRQVGCTPTAFRNQGNEPRPLPVHS